MKPWCDRPDCQRQMSHDHAAPVPPQAPETAAGDARSDAGRPVTGQEPPNGYGPQERSVGVATAEAYLHRDGSVTDSLGEVIVPSDERTPAAETADGGATPEVETDDGADPSPWAIWWEPLRVELAETEGRLERLHSLRLALMMAMAEAGVSVAEIARCAGVSRQRAHKLLNG